MVGIGCLSLSIASLALLISTQMRISPSGFGTTTRGETHSVGPLGTSSIMSSLVIHLISCRLSLLDQMVIS